MDPSQIDMIVGSLAGPLCAGGGFCAGEKDVVEHQRITAAAYTYSAALPALLATTASESIGLLQSSPEILQQCRENIKAMKAQLDPRSDWVTCTSANENPIMLLSLKSDVVRSKRLTVEDQERLLQECVDEVCFDNPRLLFAVLTKISSSKSSIGIENADHLVPCQRCFDHEAQDAAHYQWHDTGGAR